MTEKRINLQWYAMHFGTYMGVYWIAKFILLPLGLTNSFLSLLFIVLTIAVPFVGYHYVRSFRDRVCDGTISFAQSWAFIFFMYLFAGLLTAVAHYVYFRFFDNGLMVETLEKSIEASKAIPQYSELLKQYPYEEAIKLVRTLTPIEITMQFFTQNMLFCSILALITAPFAVKQKKQHHIS